MMEKKICPRCQGELIPIYPFGDQSQGIDFLTCSKCGCAYHPESMQPIGQVIDLQERAERAEAWEDYLLEGGEPI